MSATRRTFSDAMAPRPASARGSFSDTSEFYHGSVQHGAVWVIDLAWVSTGRTQNRFNAYSFDNTKLRSAEPSTRLPRACEVPVCDAFGDHGGLLPNAITLPRPRHSADSCEARRAAGGRVPQMMLQAPQLMVDTFCLQAQARQGPMRWMLVNLQWCLPSGSRRQNALTTVPPNLLRTLEHVVTLKPIVDVLGHHHPSSMTVRRGIQGHDVHDQDCQPRPVHGWLHDSFEPGFESLMEHYRCSEAGPRPVR